MSDPIFPFLSGGGQMGEVIRQKNWSETTLGTPDQWSVSLRTTISLLLNAKFPMLLYWGSESIQFYNDAYLTSLHPERRLTWIGQPGEECWKEKWPDISTEIDTVLQSGESVSCEDVPVVIYEGKTSQNHFWTCTYNPVSDDSGKVYGALVICSDTTRFSLTRQKTEETQRQVLAFFEQSPVGIAVFETKKLVFSMANPFYGYLVGRDPAEIVGKPLFEALPELAGQGFEYLLDQVFVTGEPFIAREVQVELVRNGQLEAIYVDLTYQPRREPNGEISGILVVVTDVTQQVLSRRKIEDSEKILRDMVLNAPIGVSLLNASDLVSEIVNDSFIEVAGKTYGEIINKNYWIPFAEVKSQYASALNSVAKDGIPFFANEVPMTLIRHGKEENIYVTFAYMPLTDTSGKVKKIAVWVIENTFQVTERKKIEDIVQERTQELSVANEFLSESNGLLARSNDNLERFAYVASHDLQEPLRKIQQFGDLLKRELEKDSRQAMLLDKMVNSSERMAFLIRDLLDFSKISHQRALAVPVSINQVIDQVLITLEQAVTESGASIRIEKLPEILADPMQMDQLFQNLLSNALKFRKAQQTPVIHIRCQKLNLEDLPPKVMPSRQCGQYYRIDIEDNGIGFDEQYANRIFQMFQRLHGKSEFSGTGIGLAISEKVAVNHGGALTARSQPGKGSIFSIYLPAQNDDETLL